MSRRRRTAGPRATVIWWRDLPAQVNCIDGDAKGQWILPERFQHAIDRAAMVAGASDTDTYVAQWRQTTEPLTDAVSVDESASDDEPPMQALARSLAARYESHYDPARVAAIVANGGWDPTNTSQGES